MKAFCQKIGGVMLILSIFVVIAIFQDVRVMLSETADISGNEADSEDILKSGQAVDAEIGILLDQFLTVETSQKNRAGQVTSKTTDDYYIMPVFVDDETYFVALKVGQRYEDRLAIMRMVDEYVSAYSLSPDRLNDDTVEISGGMYKLKNNYYEYMVDWFDDTNWFADEDDIEKYVLPLVFKPLDRDSTTTLIYVGVGMLVGGILLLVIGFFGRKKNAQRETELAQLGNRTITICGIRYNVAMMTEVDKNICVGKVKKAKKLLMKTFHATEAEADTIIANWNQITAQ